jgi:hypothetical protein
MITRNMMLAVFALLTSYSASLAQTCPNPPAQIDKNIEAEAKLNIGSLGRLVGLEATAKVTPITQNLFEKYPNADKITIAQLIVSTTCQLLVSSGVGGKDLLDAIDKLNSRILELMIGEKEKEQKPKTEWMDKGGSLVLINSGGKIKNFDYELYVMIRTDLHWVAQGNYGLNGLYGSRKPGVLVQVDPNSPEVFTIPLASERRAFDEALKRVADRIKDESVQDGISYIENCLHIQFDDLYGGHYSDFRVDLMVRGGGGHNSIEKWEFDECKEDFQKATSYKDSYLHGGGIGIFEFWSGSDQNQIDNLIVTDITAQIDRWKKYLTNKQN